MTEGSPWPIVGAVRAVLADLDPRVPVIEALTLEQEIQTSLWQERLVAILSAFFGVAAAMLAGAPSKRQTLLWGDFGLGSAA